jgi:hypothetical protein
MFFTGWFGFCSGWLIDLKGIPSKSGRGQGRKPHAQGKQ